MKFLKKDEVFPDSNEEFYKNKLHKRPKRLLRITPKTGWESCHNVLHNPSAHVFLGSINIFKT